MKYNFPNTKRLEQPYSLNDFLNIEEFSIKFKKQNPQGKSAFALEQILAPTRGLKKLKITIREEEISIRKFLPKQVLRNWNVANYILSLDNMTLQVPLKQDKFVTQFDPAETIASFIQPFELCRDQDLVEKVGKKGHFTLVYELKTN